MTDTYDDVDDLDKLDGGAGLAGVDRRDLAGLPGLSRRPAARRGPGAVPAAIPLANSRSEVLGELRDGVEVHVGWITPFLATVVAFVAPRYGKRLVADFQVRKMLTNLFVIAFARVVIASLLGALVNIAAPNDYMHRAWTR